MTIIAFVILCFVLKMCFNDVFGGKQALTVGGFSAVGECGCRWRDGKYVWLCSFHRENGVKAKTPREQRDNIAYKLDRITRRVSHGKFTKKQLEGIMTRVERLNQEYSRLKQEGM